ncbi:MAG: histidine triad nucleotide-binding protein [Coriobacteriia bacterium]
MDNCIFCMIARKELAAKIVWEDDDLIAFDDIAPQAPVHTLIIPKVHFDDLSSDVPWSALGQLFGAVGRIAKMKGVSDSGYRVIVNNGRDAMQSVGHLHVHILGGVSMSHGMLRMSEEDR